MIFGLLGPNGAGTYIRGGEALHVYLLDFDNNFVSALNLGKITLLNILTGLYLTTKGDAILNGFDIKTQREQVYMSIGICPQHDILWDDLTVGEHLLFYARLKGVPSSQKRAKVIVSLERVRLVPFENHLTRGLSGGEKRP